MGRLRRAGLLLFWLGATGTSATAATQAFFTSRESVEEEMIRLIEQSQSSIEMALYELKSPKLAGALQRSKARGIRVRLVLDASHRGEDLSAGEVRWLGGKRTTGRGVMHHKFVIFDKAKLVTGSFNWTPGAEHANYENALLIDDSETVSAFGREFETLWRRAIPGPPLEGAPAASNHERGRHAKHRSPWLGSKCIKIKLPKPIIKRTRRTHTNRP